MRTLMQAWHQMKWTGQFHPIPFFPFRQLLICTTRISQTTTYCFKILNNRYLTARFYLTQKPFSHPKDSLPPASRKSHIEKSCEGMGGQSTEEIEGDATVYLVCWLLLTQCSVFSMIYTTLEQIKDLVLVFYCGCLGGIFNFLESSRKVGLPSSMSKTRNQDLAIRVTPHYTIRNQYTAQHPYWHVWRYSLTSCLSGNGSIPETHNITKSGVWPLVST